MALVPAMVLLSGCQAIVSTSSRPQVRVIVASPDAPGLDLHFNSSLPVANLSFGSVTSYIGLNAGRYTVTANTAGSTEMLFSTKNAFVSGKQYTILVGETTATLQATVLEDQMQPAPSGEISLRFLDQATHVGAVDVYLVRRGQRLAAVAPLLENVGFGTAAAYRTVPPGTYSIVMVPAGTVPTSASVATYTGAMVAYAGGSATTVVLVDQQPGAVSGVQVISTADYLPPSPAGS